MTILQAPAQYSSVHDDLIYTVSDPKTADPVTYPNYKFIGDVYVGGTLVARIKKVQDPVTAIGIFNVGQIIRNYMATVFNPTANVFVAQQMGDEVFSLDVVMKFGEEYTGTTTIDITTDSSRKFFNHYNGRMVGSTTALSALADKVAANRPTRGKVFLTSSFCFVPYFPTNTNPVNYTITPVGGGSIYASSFTAASAYEMQVLNLSPVAINATNAGTINAATKYYTVEIGSQTYRFDIICEAIHEPYTLHFLNQYGGFESVIFSKVSRKVLDIQRKDYGRLPYTVDSSGQVTYKNANGVYNDSRSVYAGSYKERLTLNSDLLTDAEYTWLADLILSPMVYVEDSGYFFPCVITDNDYEPKKYVNDELTNLTINIEFGNRLNAQFR